SLKRRRCIVIAPARPAEDSRQNTNQHKRGMGCPATNKVSRHGRLSTQGRSVSEGETPPRLDPPARASRVRACESRKSKKYILSRRGHVLGSSDPELEDPTGKGGCGG